MHVVGNKAWQWSPIGSFSWEAFFKDDWGQNNLLEWCEWGITVLSRIEHSSGPSSWEFSSNSFLLHLPALDPDPWHWKKQTLERKDFSRPVGDTLPSHFLLQPTFLLNSGAYWNYRAQNVDQLTLSSQVACKIKIVIVSGWSQINSLDHQHTYYYDIQSHQ